MKKKLLIVGTLVLCVLCACCAFGCGKKKAPAAVNADSVVYDGTTFRWDAVSGATAYLIDIDSLGEGEVALPQKGYSAPKTKSEISVSIKAKNDAGTSNAVTKTFSRLQTIDADALSFDENGVMTWNNVENALSYIVSVNGQEKAVDAAVFDEFEAGKENEIKVRATGSKNTFSQFGTAVRKTYLAPPSDIEYDNDRGYLTWTRNPVADGFDVYINEVLYEQGVKANAMPYSADGHSFSVAIRAKGDGRNTFTSVLGAAVRYTMLAPVQNLGITEGRITWDPVDEATAYVVSKNSTETTVTECSAPISPGNPTTVKIKPIAQGKNFFSDWCNPVTMTVLAAPTLQWDQNLALAGDMSQAALYWNRIGNSGVGGYRVKVVTDDNPEGSIVTRDVDQTFFAYPYSTTGVYTISVMTVAAVGTDAYDSDWSTPLRVERLKAPEQNGNGYITSTPDDLSKGFKVSYKQVTGAGGYQLCTNGQWGASTTSLVTTVTDILAENEREEGKTVSYKIRAKGGSSYIVGGVKTVTLDSVDTLDFDITVLPTPKDPDFTGNDYVWSAVVGANEGRYAVKMNSLVVGTVTATRYPIADCDAGEYSVSVCATGNGGNLLPSAYSNALRLVKLAPPTDIRFDTNTNDGTLTIGGEVPFAKSYKVVTGNGVIADNNPDTGTITTVNSFVNVETVELRVYSVANYWNEGHTVYYASSKLPEVAARFTKLRAPTWGTPAFSGTTLQWNAPDNLSAAEQAGLYYSVANESDITYPGAARINSMDVADFAAGTYTFKVRALGDGTKYVNSDYSDTVDITKLQMPTLQRKKDATAYTWSGVADAMQYVIKIGEQSTTINANGVGTEHSFTPNFEATTDYQVSLVAVGDAVRYMNSQADTLTQRVTRLASLDANAFSVSYTGAQEQGIGMVVSNTGKITVTIHNALTGAIGYRFAFNGMSPTSLQVNGTVCEYPVGTPGVYEVTVAGIADYFDENGVFHKTGVASASNTIRLLSTASSVTYNTQGTIEWASAGTVPDGYIVKIYYADGSYEIVNAESNRLTADLYNTDKKKVTKIEVRTKGNGTTTITSHATTWGN